MVSEIRILDHEEVFEDTAEDNELWSVYGLAKPNPKEEPKQHNGPETGSGSQPEKVGTNPLIENPKNEGFSPTIGDKHAQKRQMGTNGLISSSRTDNDQKQSPTDQGST